MSAYSPNLISFPTLDAECHDTEARSLKKINDLLNQMNATLAAMGQPGGVQVAPTKYVYGISYQLPQGADLLDIACYNPNDLDCWVYLIIAASAPQPGMAPVFMVRTYGHNHAYYEAMTSHLVVPTGQNFYIAVSSTETSLTPNANPVYLAIRHS